MVDVASFIVMPRLRCFGRRKDRRAAICGEPAAWMLPPVHGQQPQYFCDHCKPENAEPIEAKPLFLRCSVTVECVIAGVSLVPADARREAVALVEQTLNDAGIVTSLVNATSQMGRYSPSPVRPAAGVSPTRGH